MVIRPAIDTDHDALGIAMFQAIRTGPSPYSMAQRHAWVAAPPVGADWQARLAGQYVVMAQVGETPTGFMTLRPDGYLDLAYIIPEARGAGLFRGLYAAIETHAKTQGLGRIWTHASLMAQPAFAALGFDLIRHEVVERAGQQLARAEMENWL
jgi:putative acetyltransferase